MKSIVEANNMACNLQPGKLQDSWILKLQQLRVLDVHNQPTKEEVEVWVHFSKQLHIIRNAKAKLVKFLKEHRGELAEEFVDAMKQNGVDQQVYHSGMIVSNHCMTFCEDGSKIMNNLRKAMQPKFKDANN